MLRYVFPVLILVRVFIMNAFEFYWVLFLHLLSWSCGFHLLLLWYITLTDLCMLNHDCVLGMNPTQVWCVIFLMCCWILFANNLLRIFASIFIKDIGIMLFFVWFVPVAIAMPFMKHKVRVSADKTGKDYWFLPFPDELYGKQLFGTSPMVADLQIRVCLDEILNTKDRKDFCFR